jgi:hypothetical protein
MYIASVGADHDHDVPGGHPIQHTTASPYLIDEFTCDPKSPIDWAYYDSGGL